MDEPRAIFEQDDAADLAADAEAIAELDAGLFISHANMKAWLLTWGKQAEVSD
jgi:predicted transcriptional regulator